MRKSIFKLFIIGLLLIPNISNAGYYFRDDFELTLDNTTWYTNNLWIGRGGYFALALASQDTIGFVTGGYLELSDYLTGNNDDDGAWNTELVMMSNREFTATSTEPFGFEFKNIWFDWNVGGVLGYWRRPSAGTHS